MKHCSFVWRRLSALPLLKVSVLSTILLTTVQDIANGQPTVTSSSVADNTISGGGVMQSLATAMIHHRPSTNTTTYNLDPIIAIGYEYGSAEVLVTYPKKPTLTYAIVLPAGSHNIDVVIGDDMNSTPVGDAYIVAVVYENGNDVYLNTYSITGVGTSSGYYPNPSPTATVNLSSVSAGSVASHPHIDLMGDDDNLINAPITSDSTCDSPIVACHPYPAINPRVVTLHEFAVTWHVDNNGNDEVWACVDDLQNTLTNPATYSLPPTEVVGLSSTGSDGKFPDISATWYRNTPMTNIKKAIFIAYHTTNGQDLMLQELDLDATTLTWSIRSGFPIALSSGNDVVEYPRIDGVIIDDEHGGPDNSDWAVAAAIQPNGGSHREIGIFGDPAFVSTMLTLTSTDEHLKPEIAGVGPHSFTTSGYYPDTCSGGFPCTPCGCDPTFPYPNGVAAGQYVVAYYSTYTNGSGSNGDMYANLIAIGGMSVNPNPDEINNNALSSSFSTGTQPFISIAAGANTGYDMLTAWWEGTDLNWKISKGGSGVSYKPSGIEGGLSFETKTLYPNPTSGKLIVPGAANAEYYVTDLTGRTVGSGRVNEKESLDVSSYPAGTYLLRIYNNGDLSSMKFIKE